MLFEHAKMLKALAAVGEIVGRKKLQKMIYIAKKMNFPFYEKFDFSFLRSVFGRVDFAHRRAM
ncbi:hypothetical protein LR68_01048 [Anoxybacillus sp. BCO1]|nr:hypothetical protein LR68_01048 [Anoxybacillus sp. BCO1]